MEIYFTLILVIYLFITSWLFLNLCFFLQDVKIFNDGKDFENNLIIGIVVSALSTIWFVTLPISICIQRKKDLKTLNFK